MNRIDKAGNLYLEKSARNLYSNRILKVDVGVGLNHLQPFEVDNHNSSARNRTKGEYGNCFIPQFGVGIKLPIFLSYATIRLAATTKIRIDIAVKLLPFLYAPLAPTSLTIYFFDLYILQHELHFDLRFV